MRGRKGACARNTVTDYMPGLDQLEAFLRKDPTNTVLAADLLGQLLAAGHTEHALEVIGDLPPATRADHGVLFLEARTLLQSGRAAAAAGALRSLLALGADAPAIHHDLAYAEFAQGHLDNATLALQPALRTDPPLPRSGYG